MVVFIEVIEGPQVGSQFRLFEGAALGSKGVDVLILDPQVESKHAKIQLNSTGQLCLADLSTKAGVFIGGAKVKTVLLKVGVVFGMGESFFKVTRVVHDEDTQMDMGPITWSEALVGLLQNAEVSSGAKTIKPFNPMIVLKILQGPQSGEEIPLGYGPRIFGRDCLDVQLEDPSGPEKAFELLPSQAGPVLINHMGALLFVNGQAVQKVILQRGDKIEFGTNVLELGQI